MRVYGERGMMLGCGFFLLMMCSWDDERLAEFQDMPLLEG